MKTLIGLSLLFCSTASPAQFIISGPTVTPGFTSSRSSSYLGVAPSDPSGGLGDDITPTMQRQRQEQARQVELLFPNIRDEMARQNPNRAAYTYAKAVKKMVWANLHANPPSQ